MKRISIRIPMWVYDILLSESDKRGTSMNGLINQMCYELASDVEALYKQRKK